MENLEQRKRTYPNLANKVLSSSLTVAMKSSMSFFWTIIGLLVVFRLILTDDLTVLMTYSPHDDFLYVYRAYYLLLGQAFGHYNAQLFDKLPGISFWLAGIRVLGVPYILATTLFYIAAGVYFILALLRSGINRCLLIAVFFLYLLNPVSLGPHWCHAVRENIEVCLLVWFFGSIIFLLEGIRFQRVRIFPLIGLSLVFSFALLLREEAILWYVAVFLFDCILLFLGYTSGMMRSKRSWAGLAAVIVLPLFIGFAGQMVARAFVRSCYGLPILHEMSEGEYPKLIASMRSVVSSKDHRLVMISKEALRKIRGVLPRFGPAISPVIAHRPTEGESRRYGVGDELDNGHIVFWIKDHAFLSGMTPNLVAAQKYFRDMRLEIQRACRDGRLDCRKKGEGLIPPFDLRWSRVFIHEALDIGRMMTHPSIGVFGKTPQVHPVNADVGRQYQMVIMAHHFDSASQKAYGEENPWRNHSPEIYRSLKYWLKYPDVAQHPGFGVHSPQGVSGAYDHYQKYGRYEGRAWKEAVKITDELPVFESPLSHWRSTITRLYLKYDVVLELLGLVALVTGLLWRKPPFTPLVYASIIFLGFATVRLTALAYVSVFMGGLDQRLFFSNYVLMVLMASSLIAECLSFFITTCFTKKETNAN